MSITIFNFHLSLLLVCIYIRELKVVGERARTTRPLGGEEEGDRGSVSTASLLGFK